MNQFSDIIIKEDYSKKEEVLDIKIEEEDECWTCAYEQCECGEKVVDKIEDIEQYDRYILWTIEQNGINIHDVVYFGDDMLEDMYQRILNGGIDGVYISSVEGGDDCRDKIKMWEKREEHICYSWTNTDGANEAFKSRADARQGGLW